GVILDGATLSTVSNNGFITGNVAIRVSNIGGAYQNAQFDNISITQTAPPPVFIPHAQMSATASDYNAGLYLGLYYLPSYGIDDRPESVWHSNFTPSRTPPPHWYTVDLGMSENIDGLVYQPRLDDQTNGMVQTYNVLLSNDGVNWTTVVSAGTWPVNSASK